MTACGGGGGADDSTPTDPNQAFNITKLHSDTVSTIYTSQLTGSDSNGTSYSGSVSFANRAQINLDGIMVTPSELIISLTGNGTTFTVTGASYIDSSGYLILVEVQTNGLTCVPAIPDKLPDSVRIGDFGILSPLDCSDNTTQERNWRVEDAGNGRIDVVTSGTVRNQFNTIVSTTDVTYTFDGNGDIVGFETVSNLSENGFTLTYRNR